MLSYRWIRSPAPLLCLLSVLLTACGSSDVDLDGDGSHAAQTYAIAGNLTGLAANAAVVLTVNGQHQTLIQNGGFNTGVTLVSGASYAVSVTTQPTGETCAVSNGSGTIASSNVNNIQVACTPNPAQTYTIGGQVTGLSGSVILQDNAGANLTVSATGAFAFATPLVNQAAYNVTVLTQPAGQTCSLTQAAGTVQGANITNVTVSCTNNPLPTYNVGGSLSGLPSGASVVLQDNGGGNLALSTNGSFVFPTSVGAGSAYAVTVLTQPAQATCSITNGSGTASGNVSNVQVTCAPNAYSIGGSLTGLPAGDSIVLQDNSGDNLTLTNNGAFTFSQNIVANNAYVVTVLTQPLHQACTVTNGSGTASASVTAVQVTCSSGPQFAYVANYGGSSVSAYSINASTGALTAVAGSPFAAGVYPDSIAVNPAGTVIYVANYGDSTVSAYSINVSSGALTPVAGSPFASGPNPYSVTINPAGTLAYVSNYIGNSISVYSIAANGALTPIAGSPFAAGSNPSAVKINPAGTMAYVTNAGSNNVSAYSIGSNGALTPIAGSPFAVGVSPEAVILNPAGTFAYVTNEGSGSVSAFSVAGNGALTPVAGSPFTAGSNPYAVMVNPMGTLAYVANYNGGNISAYSIGSNGALTPVVGSPFVTGATPSSIAINLAGSLAYVTNVGGNVWAYSIGSNGALTPVAGSPFAAGASPMSIAVAQP